MLPRRGLLRFIGLTLAALPLFLGFLWILVDDRRRGLHDLLARTVVVEQGVLRSYLLDTYTGRKLGLPSTGTESRRVLAVLMYLRS